MGRVKSRKNIHYRCLHDSFLCSSFARIRLHGSSLAWQLFTGGWKAKERRQLIVYGKHCTMHPITWRCVHVSVPTTQMKECFTCQSRAFTDYCLCQHCISDVSNVLDISYLRWKQDFHPLFSMDCILKITAEKVQWTFLQLSGFDTFLGIRDLNFSH